LSSELELELSKQFKAAQEKYIYFLLAVAASAIGYAITQAKVEPLQYIHISYGLSILFWALSFYSGLQFSEYAISQTFQNWNYLTFKRELKSYPPDKATVLFTEFKKLFDKTHNNQNSKKEFWGKLQSRSLLLGAIFYIAWHIARMINATGV